MKKTLIAASLACAAGSLPSFAFAQSTTATPEHAFTGNLSLVSEYRYRGIAQTNARPAVQGGFDYAHASGLYAGTWMSNVSWLSDAGAGAISSSVEWDFYGGYKGAVGDIGYDVGLLYYYYPGKYPSGFNSPDTLELYGALSWQMLTLKYSHALTDLFGFTDSKGSGYLDLSGNFDAGSGVTLTAHVGHQKVDSNSNCSYTDWKLGATKEMVGLTWGLAYVGTDADGGVGECYRNAFNRDLGKGTVVLSVARTF